MMQLFHEVSQRCSQYTAQRYSTSFSSAIRLLHKDLRPHIFNIYGLVRFADEIVDTFYEQDKRILLENFRKDTCEAIERGISLNPILHSFQITYNKYKIDRSLLDAFFHSMEMDIDRRQYSQEGYNEYIYGSAEVVGLMCLYVFCEGNNEKYVLLKDHARSLGAAFQKVNFLRDIKADYKQLKRTYFPGFNYDSFTDEIKRRIEEEIEADFRHAYQGILHLPLKARFGVYVAYKYYFSLFRKIKRLHPAHILHNRVRIADHAKAFIVLRAGLRHSFKIL